MRPGEDCRIDAMLSASLGSPPVAKRYLGPSGRSRAQATPRRTEAGPSAPLEVFRPAHGRIGVVPGARLLRAYPGARSVSQPDDGSVRRVSAARELAADHAKTRLRLVSATTMTN